MAAVSRTNLCQDWNNRMTHKANKMPPPVTVQRRGPPVRVKL